MFVASHDSCRGRWPSFSQLLLVAFVSTGSTSVAHALTPNEAGLITQYQNGHCLQPASNSQGANVRQDLCTGASNQRFSFEPMGDGSYRIRHADTGLCVDVSGGSTGNGANLILWGCGGQNNQRWTADETAASHLRLISRHSGKCVDVPNGTDARQTNIIQYDCNRGFNQEFMFLSPGFFAAAHGPFVTLEAVHSGKLVDVSDLSRTEGAAIHQWTNLGASNQRWEYLEVARDAYVVRSMNSDLCMAPENGSNADGAKIRQYRCSGALAQRWRNEFTGGDVFSVTHLASGKVLDVTGGPSFTGDGTPLQLYGNGGATNQQFRVHRDPGDRAYCSSSDPAACRPDVVTSGNRGDYSNCQYGYNTGASWYNDEYVYFDAVDRCAWWHDWECWSRNNRTGAYEGFGGCSQDVNYIACVEQVRPVTAEEATSRDCVLNSMLENAAGICEPWSSRGSWYPLYNAEREGGTRCDDATYSPGRPSQNEAIGVCRQ